MATISGIGDEALQVEFPSGGDRLVGLGLDVILRR